LLIAGLGGTIAYYTMAIGQLNTTISALNSQVSSLNSQVSSLESLLDATPTTVSELVNDTSVWVNRTVALEGNISGPIITSGDMQLPYGYRIDSNGQGIGLSFSTGVNLTSFYSNRYVDAATFNTTDHGVVSTRVYFLNSSITVIIYGVVKEGEVTYGWGMPLQVAYYIEAEKIKML
jgi:hypothetical protein